MLPHFPVSGKNTTDKLTFALGMYVPEAKVFLLLRTQQADLRYLLDKNIRYELQILQIYGIII